MSVARVDEAERLVKQYYDENTRRFLAFGQGGNVGAIHRAVWGPGVTTRAMAFNYVNELLVEELRGYSLESSSVLRVVDLGCGVGASLMYIAERHPVDGLGITLSPLQARMAQQRFAELKDVQLECVQGSFLEVPAESGSVDCAYAIEAFIHAADARRFLDEAARLLKPGGLLMLCDDFMTESAAADPTALGSRRARWLREFKKGWRVNTLRPVSEVLRLGAEHFELEQDVDLTQYVELGRPRDVAIRWLVRAGRYLPLKAPWWGNFLGGNGLQRCLLSGVVCYRVVVLRRRA